MTNENIVTLQVRFTRTRALMALALFFLCWHPKPVGSESLVLTTYYPAPYGGYVNILTTGNTVLARDNGVANSYVRLGRGYNGANGRRDNNVKLEVGDGDISTMANIKWGTSRGVLSTDQGSSIELGGAGTPYIDFSQNTGQDFSARLWLAGAGQLQAVGDLNVTGSIIAGGTPATNSWIRGYCNSVTYGGGTSRCTNGRVIMGHYPTGSCVSGGQLFLGGDFTNPARWVAHTEPGCRGVMICCSIERP